MPWVPEYCPRYAELLDADFAWTALAHRYDGKKSSIGESVHGRRIRLYEFGDARRPTVFLSSLMHGIELIGGLALFDSVKALLQKEDHPHLVVIPNVNPDGVTHNLSRLTRGLRAGRRGNARGVDLNRNFGWISDRMPWHPLSGSRWSWSPHYIGPEPFSEPETQAVRTVAEDYRPVMSIGFHSFGNMLLYPWAHTDRPNPRDAEYRALASKFTEGLVKDRYQVRTAADFYPTVGDMDDWLDHQFGTFSFTVEVSRLCRRLWSAKTLFNPFCWMNPKETAPVLSNLVPGIEALVQAAWSLSDLVPATPAAPAKRGGLPYAAR